MDHSKSLNLTDISSEKRPLTRVKTEVPWLLLDGHGVEGCRGRTHAGDSLLSVVRLHHLLLEALRGNGD